MAVVITSAQYDYSSHVLLVTGTGFQSFAGADNDIVASLFSLTGEAGATYALADTPDVDFLSGTSFALTLGVSDRAAVELILNKNGLLSTGGATFNLEAAEDWARGEDPADAIADVTGNGISVLNVPAPSITSASYNSSTQILTVIGTGFTSFAGASNDIVASRLTLTGEGGATRTLTSTADADIVSATSFSLIIAGADIAALNALLNKNGTTSIGGLTYNIAASEDWARGADPAVFIADSISALSAVYPSVTSVAVPVNSTYDVGQNLDFTVNCSQAVLVNTGAGTPRIAISLDGGTLVYASYISGSGTNSLSFRLTLAAEMTDLTGISLASTLDLNGGTINDAVGNALTLMLNSVPSTAGVLIANSFPTLTGDMTARLSVGGSYILSAQDLGYLDADDTDSTTTFEVSILRNGSIQVGGVAVTSFTPTQLSTGSVTFVHSGASSPSAGFTVSVEDQHDASASSSFKFLVKLPPDTPPTVSAPNPDTSVKAGEPFSLQLGDGHFYDGQNADLTYFIKVNGGTLPSWLSFDPATGKLTGTPTTADAGTYSLLVNASDGELTSSDELVLTIVADYTKGADVIGGKGDNNLVGDALDNLIDGRKGNDTLTGGDGADAFVLGEHYGHDRALDFDPSEGDTIDLSNAVGIRSFKDLMAHHLDDTDAGLKIIAADGSRLFLKDIDASDLTVDMFAF